MEDYIVCLDCGFVGIPDKNIEPDEREYWWCRECGSDDLMDCYKDDTYFEMYQRYIEIECFADIDREQFCRLVKITKEKK